MLKSSLAQTVVDATGHQLRKIYLFITFTKKMSNYFLYYKKILLKKMLGLLQKLVCDFFQKKMRILILCAVLIVGSQAVSFSDLVQEQWEAFKLTHQKEYQNETEERFRMKIFMENAHKVAKHNKLYDQGLVTYTLGINKYSDMLDHEFVHTLNGFNISKSLLGGQEMDDAVTFIPPANVQIPDKVDWREKGAVTPIKDQGYCGSCWSFSATGSLEGQHFRKTNKLVSLSEQNLIDCSTDFGNDGCNGGLMDLAFKYIKKNGGIDTESSYPYQGVEGNCSYNPKNNGATDRGFVDIPSGDEDKLKVAIATVGPISVAIDASHNSFQLYNGGLYIEPDCSSELKVLDHAVLAVGYGTTDDGKDYWLVKNSWGAKWGENGYIRMARNKDNMCGIATYALYPLV